MEEGGAEEDTHFEDIEVIDLNDKVSEMLNSKYKLII